MTEQQAELLKRPFTAKEIEWRVLITTKDKAKGQVAAYVDSRAIQRRLDKVIGRENWQNSFTVTQGKNGENTIYVCELKIYYPERNEWITKSDGAGSTDIEPVKGGLSNAFKRSASMWGIGRYLYDLDGIWVALKDGKYIADSEFGKIDAAYARFLKSITADKTAAKPELADGKKPQPVTDQLKPKPSAAAQTGRFAEQGAPAPDVCRVIDLKVSRGERETTLVTLQKPDGKSVTGYIRGIADLKTGQNIKDIKITRKTHPVSGFYNIIESYKPAA